MQTLQGNSATPTMPGCQTKTQETSTHTTSVPPRRDGGLDEDAAVSVLTPGIHLTSFRVQETFQSSKQTWARHKVTGETEAQESHVTPGELIPDPSRVVGCIIICVQGQTHHLLTDQHRLPVTGKSEIWGSSPRAPGPSIHASQGSELSEHWQAPCPHSHHHWRCLWPSAHEKRPASLQVRVPAWPGDPSSVPASLLCGHCFHFHP